MRLKVSLKLCDGGDFPEVLGKCVPEFWTLKTLPPMKESLYLGINNKPESVDLKLQEVV